jgi:D-alanyl-D-alanine carboxypeptidase/D-alanyl-D-alanine-endopeptidase (penicillin-binding protein 4)
MINKNLVTLFLGILCVAATACSTQKKVARLANNALLTRPEVATAHVGISIMDAATQQYLFNYQGDKYFIPASNTKLLTCYAAMKYLGDSLEGLRYNKPYIDKTGKKVMEIEPTGDPTFLHPDFKRHPVFDFLKSDTTISFAIASGKWKETAWGNGWAWNDYQDDYMVERSLFPVYGNVTRVTWKSGDYVSIIPSYFSSPDLLYAGAARNASSAVERERNANRFVLYRADSSRPFKALYQEIPFVTSKDLSAALLHDTVRGIRFARDVVAFNGKEKYGEVIHSQPVDSMLRLMMFRSDNFYAEQSLLMVSGKKLNVMNDAAIIDTLLKTDYAGMPQAPKWVDGSGLSRYNLITPQDFVWLLNKMKQDFSWQRITGILQTGGQGTLSSYYKKYAGRIYAKTGTLSNNVSLSGYLITNKGRTLAFSVMVNNHKAAVANIRREVEAFLGEVIENY